jgi:hypothetical protein
LRAPNCPFQALQPTSRAWVTDHPSENVLSDDGLRYKAKANNSNGFFGSGTAATLSCTKCGLHKPRKDGSFKRRIDKLFFYCAVCTAATKKAT